MLDRICYKLLHNKWFGLFVMAIFPINICITLSKMDFSTRVSMLDMLQMFVWIAYNIGCFCSGLFIVFVTSRKGNN